MKESAKGRFFENKVTSETPIARKCLDQNDHWVYKFQLEKYLKDLRWGQVMAAKTVENGKKITKSSNFSINFLTFC